MGQSLWYTSDTGRDVSLWGQGCLSRESFSIWAKVYDIRVARDVASLCGNRDACRGKAQYMGQSLSYTCDTGRDVSLWGQGCLSRESFSTWAKVCDTRLARDVTSLCGNRDACRRKASVHGTKSVIRDWHGTWRLSVGTGMPDAGRTQNMKEKRASRSGVYEITVLWDVQIQSTFSTFRNDLPPAFSGQRNGVERVEIWNRQKEVVDRV
jgi:hypothetical protein